MTKRFTIFIAIVAILVAGAVAYVYDSRYTIKNNSPLPLTEDPTAMLCRAELSALQMYLRDEKLSEQFTFDKYKVTENFTAKPASLDAKSSRSAAEFKSKLDAELAAAGVNFAGHYSIVQVGMTGWGANYWIVDRKTGKAYEFPYYATTLEFRAGSSLIVMNSKASITRLLEEQPEQACYFYNQQKVTDLRPFYFEWKDNKLTLLGPTTLKPRVNAFWTEYFATSTAPVAGRRNLQGVLSCLPHRDGATQTKECRLGLRTDDGKYHAIDFNLMSQSAPGVGTGDRISANGVYTPVMALSSMLGKTYKIEGSFSVTDSVQFVRSPAGAQPEKKTLTGEYLCLPHRNTEGPQTAECALGIKTSDGAYYALDFSLMSSMDWQSLPMGKRITVSGAYTPAEKLEGNAVSIYPIQGRLSVTEVSK